MKIGLRETVHTLPELASGWVPRLLVGRETIIGEELPQRRMDSIGEATQHVDRRLPAADLDVRHIGRTDASAFTESLGEQFAGAWRLLVDQHGPKQAARLFAQVLKAVEARGMLVVASEVRGALASGDAIQLAVRAKPSVQAAVPAESLPAGLASIEVAAGDAADYVTWLGARRARARPRDR